MNVSIKHPTDRPNFSRVTIGNITLWFSYETCVAFTDPETFGTWVSENVWGPTTGKHLNYIDPDHTHRLNRTAFTERLSAVLAKIG